MNSIPLERVLKKTREQMSGIAPSVPDFGLREGTEDRRMTNEDYIQTVSACIEPFRGEEWIENVDSCREAEERI